MKLKLNKQPAAPLNILLLTIAIMLSGNAFAIRPVVTQVELDAVYNDLNDKIVELQDLIAILHAPTIGEERGGGVVFYIDEAEKTGLIASLDDQSIGIQWYNGEFELTYATGDGVGAGALNTSNIVAVQGLDVDYAAKIADEYSVQEDGVTPCGAPGTPGEICRDDWYLPSQGELTLMFQQKDVVGIPTNNFYWSSTEVDQDSAYYQAHDTVVFSGSKSFSFRVRAVRAFSY